MNRMNIRLWSVLASILLLNVLSACDDDEPALPDNVMNFPATELGFEETESEIDIVLTASRAVDADVTLTVALGTDGVTYGTEFTTVPAANNGTLSLVIPRGQDRVSFTVVKTQGVFLQGDESITFEIQSTDDAVVIGTTSSIELKFSAIVSEGASFALNGLIGAEAGSSAGNSVFVDFSSNVQSPVARTSWDLGFYSGDAFRVILNNTSGASVVKVDKTDLAQVTAADVNASDLAIGFGTGSFDAYDSLNGNLDHTAIGEVSATASENKVFVINRVGGTGTTQAAEEFVKIRVLRKENGYTLQYAKINETTFKTLDIPKKEDVNFNYASFDNGAVTVEPSHWDIEWTWSIYATPGPDAVPYAFSDLVFINHHGGVEAAEVLTSTVTYDDFDESDVSSVTFSSDRNVIGSNWRVTQGAVGVRTDRFYAVMDASGNVYKLRFLNFHSADGGTRGKPLIEYKLVKKAG